MTEQTKKILKQNKWIHDFKGYLPNLSFSGVYLLSFPNGKWYVGSSNNLGKRLSSHLKNLQKPRSTKWYAIAQKENHIPFENRATMPKEPEEPIYIPPEGDPRLELDKNGRRKGERASKKAIEEYLKKCEEPYNQFCLAHEKWIDDYSDWMKDCEKWEIEQIKWWELPSLGYVGIHYCECNNYRDYEDQILRSIEDKKLWYNTQYLVYDLKKFQEE